MDTAHLTRLLRAYGAHDCSGQGRHGPRPLSGAAPIELLGRALWLIGGVLVVPIMASAQNAGYPAPEVYAEMALASENAPLFGSEAPLKLTLRTRIDWLRRERNDSVEVEGTATFVDLDGTETVRPVDVRARGNFRRDPRYCNFPPLRLDFPKSQMDGTAFEGENRLKLVTPCQDDRDEYQDYIFDEYLAYRVAALLTPVSFRVRLVEITYEDVDGRYDTRTKMGFLIESDERMAARNRATIVETPTVPPRSVDGDQAVLTAMFSYMIGNLDWSPVRLHNVVLIRTEEGRYLTVPYDFDFAGVVYPRYARGPRGVPVGMSDRVRSVRDRLYRGFCRPQLSYEAVAEIFQSKRPQIEELYRNFDLYVDGDAGEDALDFYEEFWEVVDDPGKFEDRILDECRELP